MTSGTNEVGKSFDPNLFGITTGHQLNVFAPIFLKNLLVLTTHFDERFQAISHKGRGED